MRKELNWVYYRDYPLKNPNHMQGLQDTNKDNSGPGPGLLCCSAHSADDGNQFVLGPDYATVYVMWDAERKSQFDQFCRGKTFR